MCVNHTDDSPLALVDILGKIAVAVVKALHYLHSQLKVIHRDVKPSNIRE